MPSRTPPPSDHFDGERFFNPGVNTDKSFQEVMRWSLSGERVKWPKRIEDGPARFIDGPPPPGAMAVTYVGHATLLIQTGEVNILTDPIFSERASPFAWAGPRRARAPGLPWEKLPRIDIVLLSHNHYDHMDLRTLRRLGERFRPAVVTGLRNAAPLARAGITAAVELDWWESAEPKPGVRVSYVPAQHWSSRTGFDRRRALWGGHMVESAAGRLFFAGDTGYGAHFAAIRERFGAPDVSLLPIGAYEPRWFMGAQHMNPDDAVRAHLDLDAALSVAMHFGTFQLTDEGIDAPLEALAAARRVHGVAAERFRAPGFGETIVWGREAGRR